MNRFDRKFWKRLWRVAKPYWTSAERRQGFVLLIVVCVLGGLTIALQAYFTYINRDLTNALVARNQPKFYRALLLFLGWFLVMVPIEAYYPWLIGRLTIVWREWLTHRYVAMGFQHRAFYRMGETGNVDNPDQRISEDLDSFASGTLDFFLLTAGAILTTVTFFGILWSLSRFLALVLIVYAAIGSYVSAVVGRRLVTINFNQQRYEADFRFGLVHVRDNAEPIFMYGGEAHETNQLNSRFSNLVRNFNLLILWRRHLGFVTASYGNLISLLPWFLLAPTYFAGKLEYGQIVQAASAFLTLQLSLSLIVNNFQRLTGYAAVVNRLATFEDECEAADAAEFNDRERIKTVEEQRIAFEALTLATPDRRKILVSDLSLAASDLEPLLLKGPSGAGKTSLLRALAGIWIEGGGLIVRPPLADVMFLPQRPYMLLGSLRDQLCYPRATPASDEQLRAMLAEVNLADLPERFGGLDAEMNWTDVLSPGEQQRIAFARLLLNRPRYAFLDEATSALDADNEALLYERLSASGISFLSAGHRPTLLKYHRNVLELAGPHDWTLSPSPMFSASESEVE